MSAPCSEPAFPVQDASKFQCHGMTLRDYFVAHAPAEPPQWFKPVMSSPAPKHPQRPRGLTESEREELSAYGDWLGEKDLKEPRIIAYAALKNEYRKQADAWAKEYEQAKVFQWPFAWADAMLIGRDKATGSAA